MAINDIASAGTMVGASLETAGIYQQSFLIDSLSGSAFGTIGSLLLLIAVIMGLITFLITGQGKGLLWFFVGPAILYFVYFNRTEVGTTSWRFARYERPQTNVDYVSQATLDPDLLKYPIGSPSFIKTEDGGQQSAKVSWLFAWYNDIVSSITREVSYALANGKGDLDVRFMMNAGVFRRLAMPQMKEPGLQHLLHTGFMGECAPLVQASEKIVSADYGNVGGGTGGYALGTDRCNLVDENYEKNIYALIREEHSLQTASTIDYIANLIGAFPFLKDDLPGNRTCAAEKVRLYCKSSNLTSLDEAEIEKLHDEISASCSGDQKEFAKKIQDNHCKIAKKLAGELGPNPSAQDVYNHIMQRE